MKVVLGADHRGYPLKEVIKNYLLSQGHEVIDVGAYSTDTVDYPEKGSAAGMAIANGEAERGIVVCGSGVGISIAANKVNGVRCALCSDSLTASLSRQHNNANMLAMGALIVGESLALDMVETFMITEFEGGRHEKRVAMLGEIEQNQK